MTAFVAEVVVDAGTRSIQNTYSYLIPERMVQQLRVGHRIYVSFGRQYVQGYVVHISEPEVVDAKLKPVLAVLDPQPLLTQEILSVCKWLVHRYACTLLDAIHTVLPGAYKVQAKRVYRGLTEEVPTDPHVQSLWEVLCTQPLSFEEILRRFGADASFSLESLIVHNNVVEQTSFVDTVKAKKQVLLKPAMNAKALQDMLEQREKRAPKQGRILAVMLERLRAGQGQIPLKELDLTASDSSVQSLLRAGCIELEEEEVYRTPTNAGLEEPMNEGRELTRLQEIAVDAVTKAVANPKQNLCVLHGVTGSGKTEVYIQSIRGVLEYGGGAIVLVPEIVLTPQMVGRFVHHFRGQVALLHSGLSQGERRDEWLRVRRGEARLVIGARSAVFAPVSNLKLLIIDEEHENSYKQEETPYYDARQVAAFRAVEQNGVALYGSATPSLQIMHQVETGAARLLTLPTRINEQPLPPVEVVDMREELRAGNTSIFSQSMMTGLEEAISNGRQAVLFLNRRGYAAFVLCRECGEVMECPHCDISLTLHGPIGRQFLECHYCHFQVPLVKECPQCHEPALRPFGLGTQQVEHYLAKMWPDWRVLRMDVDTTRKKGSHQAAIQQFYDGDADILLGTQMIAKGLDFPNVTFVGVIAADTLLSVPDYRASERTFSLLTQVAGRAGRADFPGRIVVQTFRPTHYAIASAAGHNYTDFYAQERGLREAFEYPPFCEMAVLKAVHSQENVAKGAAHRFERELRRRLTTPPVTILPASPDRISRVEDKFRYQVVVKYSRWEDVSTAIAESFSIVETRMRKLKGTCVLDVNAGRI